MAFDQVAFHETLTHAIRQLLKSRVQHGHWEGELSSSALSTATAVLALLLFVREGKGRIDQGLLDTCQERIAKGRDWLVRTQNPDGGFGDTVRSVSNVSTTALVWAALAPSDESQPQTLAANEAWLLTAAGSLEPQALAATITRCYGSDRTFSAPILTACALAGRFGSGAGAWNRVPQLPFELALCPQQWFKRLRLPVVSYALPALIAIGQVRHHFSPTRNPILRPVRALARRRTLDLLETIQPDSGGYLEAVPLTSFVVMSLVAAGQVEHAVVSRGVSFLVGLARDDGSWPIDTNLATWLTTLSIGALSTGECLTPHWTGQDRQNLRHWLLKQQFRKEHPYTHAEPGGWAWTDRPGGVPDADDTAGALLALRNMGPIDRDVIAAAVAGVDWLLNLQNSDGGIPTFCRGWGRLPFDRSTPDLTAHALLAWSSWHEHLPTQSRSRLHKALQRALRYLAASQREDGAWAPLWFGNELAPEGNNLTYGTARVILAFNFLSRQNSFPLDAARMRGIGWLLAAQNDDGGWGGASGVVSSIEETALAVQTLADSVGDLPSSLGSMKTNQEIFRTAIATGVSWLIQKTERGQHFQAEPIGLYFSKLWYFEREYPLIFTVAALSRAASSGLRM